MNTTSNTVEKLITDKTLTETCFGACEKIAAQLGQVKSSIVAEFLSAFKTQEHLLRLAIAEADALVWQTDYPHLLFPALATEKIQRAADWQARQQLLLHSQSAYALAA